MTEMSHLATNYLWSFCLSCSLWRDGRVSGLQDVFRVETKLKLNMQFWHREICVIDRERYFLLPFRVLHPIAHCASTVALLLIFLHRNKPSFFFFVHTEHLLWFSHWERLFPYTTNPTGLCVMETHSLRYELNFKPIWLISHFKTILTRDMFFTHATIFTINLRWNNGGEKMKMLGLRW